MTSKVTSKGQVTIPKKIRDQLHVAPGDTLVYEIEGNRVFVRKAEPFDEAWHQGLSETLDEWNSPENQEAWSDL
jgi:antitoxin PrlF